MTCPRYLETYPSHNLCTSIPYLCIHPSLFSHQQYTMMALIITPEESSRAETNHYTNSTHLDFEPCSNPCYTRNPYIVSQTSTSVVIRTQEELDREEMEQPHIIRRRPTCRFMNTAFFKDLKAIGGAEDLEDQQRYIEDEEYEEEYGEEEYRGEYGGDEVVLYKGEDRLPPMHLNPLGNDLPPGHDPPLGFGHPSWEPIGDLAVQEAEEIISSLEMIPELPEPQDDQSDSFLYTERDTGPEFSEPRDNRSDRVQYIERTISALSGEFERPGPGESHSQVSQSQSQSDEWLTASDASSRTWVTHVTAEHRPLWGETKPIGTKLIVSRLNEHEPSDPEGLDLYYLPDLKEWRPFPVEVEVWNAPEPVQVLKKKSRVKRFASAVVTRIKCGAYGHHVRAPLDKRLISMPVEGSKRGMIEALLDDK